MLTEFHHNILENLELLEGSFLQLEKALPSGAPVSPLAHVMFRVAHNAKGGLAVLEVKSGTQLLHEIESGLDAMRKRGDIPHQDFIDSSLKGISLLGDVLEGEQCDRELAEIAAKVAQSCTRFSAAKRPSTDELPIPLDPDSEKIYRWAVADKSGIYKVEKLIDPSLLEGGYQSLPLLMDISDLGTLIGIYPTFDSLKDANGRVQKGEIVIQVLFQSDKPKNVISESIFDSIDEIQAKSDVSESRALTEPILFHKNPLRILIVDDDFVAQKFAFNFLRKYGDCDVAVDGREGVIAWLTAKEENRPYSLVLLDIQMPNMSGRKLLRYLREAEDEQEVSFRAATKVIMASSLSDKRNVLGSFREGCEAFLPKPFTHEKLYDTMKKLKLVPPLSL